MANAEFDASYKPYLALMSAGHLIDSVLSSEDRPQLGIKYGCFNGVDRHENTQGPVARALCRPAWPTPERNALMNGTWHCRSDESRFRLRGAVVLHVRPPRVYLGNIVDYIRA